MYRLWWMLPIIALWLFFFIGHTFIGRNPFSEWWNFPLLFTMVISLALSFVIATEKGSK